MMINLMSDTYEIKINDQSFLNKETCIVSQDKELWSSFLKELLKFWNLIFHSESSRVPRIELDIVGKDSFEFLDVSLIWMELNELLKGIYQSFACTDVSFVYLSLALEKLQSTSDFFFNRNSSDHEVTHIVFLSKSRVNLSTLFNMSNLNLHPKIQASQLEERNLSVVVLTVLFLEFKHLL